MMEAELYVMKAQTLEIYDIFNKDLKLTEDKARKVVSFIEDANNNKLLKPWSVKWNIWQPNKTWQI